MPLTLKMLDNGDLDLRDGRGPILVDAEDAAKSQLTALFATNEGEWSYNTEWGIPYNGALLGKFFDESASSAILADEVSDLSALSPCSSGNVSFVTDPNTRELAVKISPVFAISGESFDFVSSP